MDDDKFFAGEPPPGNPIFDSLGRFFATFAISDFILKNILGHLLGEAEPSQKAEIILHRVSGFAARLSLLRDLLAASKIDQDSSSRLVWALSDLTQANARRNIYAHSLYSHNNAGRVKMLTHFFEGNRRSVEEALTYEAVEADLALLHHASWLVNSQLGRYVHEETQPTNFTGA